MSEIYQYGFTKVKLIKFDSRGRNEMALIEDEG